MDGLLIIDKPQGPTSHDVVARMRRVLRERRIGHTGTLDPMATGVLPLVLGRATRLAKFMSASDKTYEAAVRLGVATDSGDAQGTPVGAVSSGPWPAREAIDAALDAFRGTFLQQPPAFSAKLIDGTRSMDIDDIHDAAVPATQFGSRRLRQKQRRFKVGTEQIVPLLLAHLVQRCGIKTGSIVHQRVEMPELSHGLFDHLMQCRDLQQIGFYSARRIRANFIQFGTQCQRLIRRSMIMDRDIRSRCMQTAHDGRADALRSACHQYSFALHRTPHKQFVKNYCGKSSAALPGTRSVAYLSRYVSFVVFRAPCI